jgi:hypothetical protein
MVSVSPGRRVEKTSVPVYLGGSPGRADQSGNSMAAGRSSGSRAASSRKPLRVARRRLNDVP